METKRTTQLKGIEDLRKRKSFVPRFEGSAAFRFDLRKKCADCAE